MLNRIPSAYRGIFFSTAALVLFFLIYLGINTALSKAAIHATQQQELILRATNNGTFTGDSNLTISNSKRLLNGGQITLGNTSYDVDAISELAPATGSSLTTVIKRLEENDATRAANQFTLITDEIATTVNRKHSMLSVLQIVVGLLTLLLFAAVVTPLMRRSIGEESTQVRAQDESQHILNTVSEGLFLMRSDFEIGIEQSASLKKIFRSERDLDGDFFEFISQYVTPKTAQVARDYIELLFGQRVKERLIEDLNPLKQVEISISRRDGTMEDRYLDFSFKRVLDGKEMKHLMCSVTDVSREVLLEKRLKQAEEESEAQLDLLMSVLHVDPKQLRTFFTSAEEGLDSINATLEEHASFVHEHAAHSDGAIRRKLESIGATAHKLKGDAAILGLNKFEFAAHDFENELKTLQASSEKVTGKELLPLVTHLKTLYAEVDTMRQLVGRFASLLDGEAARDKAMQKEHDTDEDSAQLIQSLARNEPLTEELSDVELLREELTQLAATVSERQNKLVQLEVDIDDAKLDLNEHSALRDIAIQLVRNSIVHGIEPSDARQHSGKPEVGRIILKIADTEDGIRLSVADDGAGLDLDAIRAQATYQGLISNSNQLSEKQLVGLIFKPGFSSRSSADLDGGQGIGLDIVNKTVRDLGGRIGLSQSAGKSCRFTVQLPATA